VAALAVRLVDCVEVDIVGYIQIEPHYSQLNVLAPPHRLALAYAVVGKDLKEGIVFCGVLEIKPEEKDQLRYADWKLRGLGRTYSFTSIG
jgi:hypothetical protein